MSAVGQAAALMALMRELEGVMLTEMALLREMRLDRLRALQEEKTALADAYERELRRLRGAPDVVSALEPEARLALEDAMRSFQSTAKSNDRQLEAARKIVEGIVRALGESLASSRTAGSYRPGRPPAGGGRVVSLALNREI